MRPNGEPITNRSNDTEGEGKGTHHQHVERHGGVWDPAPTYRMRMTTAGGETRRRRDDTTQRRCRGGNEEEEGECGYDDEGQTTNESQEDADNEKENGGD